MGKKHVKGEDKDKSGGREGGWSKRKMFDFAGGQDAREFGGSPPVSRAV